MSEKESELQKAFPEKENTENVISDSERSTVPAEQRAPIKTGCVINKKNTDGVSTGAGSSKGGSAGGKKRLVFILIALIGVVAIVGGYWLISGGGSQPQDAVYQFLQHLNNGEYNQCADMLVDPGTLQPLSDTEKASITAKMESTFGPDGIKISAVKILSEQKVNDNQYLFKVSVTGTVNEYGMKETGTSVQTVTVVNADWQWKIVKKALFS
jgi:hypothetical protein